MLCRQLLFFIIGIIIAERAYTQIASDQVQGIDSLIRQLPHKYLSNVSSRIDQIEQKLDKQSSKALALMQRQELQIRKKLKKVDTLKAKQLFGGLQQQYSSLSYRLQNNALPKSFIPSLDTLEVSLKFLQQNPWLLSRAKNAGKKLKEAQERISGLENSFQRAEEIKKFLKERRQYLRDQMGQLGNRRYAKELKKLNKQVYYYNTQLNEYKTLLKDHKKAERKALELLTGTELFKDFMQKNSQLASIFRLPTDPGDPIAMINLAGLQTRVQVNNLIQQQISTGGPNAQMQFSQNMQQAQSQINNLKNKITQSGKSSADDIMPESFKPNAQKTRSFLQRLEIGTDLQTQKANGFFPVTSDLGLSFGYKLNDKSTVGIGGSFKTGWGKDIRHIHISHQGMGLRSFIDWKIKGSLWLSGGYEMNYRVLPRMAGSSASLVGEGLKMQRSGLIGLSKKYQITKRLKGKLQLLWDFLSYQQIPGTQPIILRVGYNLK